jgi:cytochrome b subunit of formate dehydrogenase
MTDPLLDYGLPAVIVLVVLAVTGLIVWAALSGGADCAQGQQLQFWYYQPIVTQYSTTLMPIYHCVAGAA